MPVITGSTLFAGERHIDGPYHCYYCGASCDSTHRSETYVKDSFTNRDIVKFPASPYCCVGCVDSLGMGDDSMLMIDGTSKVRQNARGMAPRMYSWVLSATESIAATKAHIRQLRATMLEPPVPPFAIILADSGQKQLVFRAPIAMDRHDYSLLLEDVPILLNVDELRDRVTLATMLCAAMGKPALLGEIGYNSFFRYEEYFGTTDGLEQWLRIREQPMSRLAAWLAPSKEDAQNEYHPIERGAVPAAVGRDGRSRPDDAGRNKGSGPDGSSQVHFDFG